MSTIEENCTDFLPERNWVFGLKTLDCIDGQSLFDNVVYDTGLVQLIAVASASVLVNIGLFINTIRKQVHPKFRLLPGRWICIALHIIAATIEFASGLIAWFIPGEYTSYATRTMAIASLVHCATTLYQIPIVFGIHIVMVPGYLFVTVCKVLTAVNLLLFPSCYIRVLVLFNVMSNYAWTRMFISLFVYFSIFEGCQYATALLISSAITLPSMGPGMMLYAAIAIALYIRLLSVLYHNSGDKLALMFNETSGNPFNNKSLENIFFAALEVDEKSRSAEESNTLDEKIIKILFDGMDTNGDGLITPDDAKHYALKVKEKEVFLKLKRAFQDRLEADEETEIDFETFRSLFSEKAVFRSHDSAKQLREKVAVARKQRDYDFQAKIIFDLLDRNSDNKITLNELGIVLIEFGLPPSEVRYLFLRYDGDNSGFLEFDEFKKYFRPLWRYAFNEFVVKLKTWDRKQRRINRLKEIEDAKFAGEQDSFREFRKSARISRNVEALREASTQLAEDI